MTARRALFPLLAAALLAAAAAPLAAQSPDDQAAMEAMARAATPGPMHAFWASHAGKWKVHTRMWMQPGTEPLESDATAEMAMILGGRYVQEIFHGQTPMGPFEGRMLMGYDNTTGVVTAVWIDDMSTAVSVLTGKGCEPGKPLELSGSYVDPVTGQTLGIRTVTTYKDADHYHFDYYMQPPGEKEFLSMAMEYERVTE